jgi:hypothetical protein
MTSAACVKAVHQSANGIKQAFVFVATASSVVVAWLGRWSEKVFENCCACTATKAQDERLKALEAFKQGEVDLLVCTDVAARGLDIKDVPAVFNFDMCPSTPKTMCTALAVQAVQGLLAWPSRWWRLLTCAWCLTSKSSSKPSLKLKTTPWKMIVPAAWPARDAETTGGKIEETIAETIVVKSAALSALSVALSGNAMTIPAIGAAASGQPKLRETLSLKSPMKRLPLSKPAQPLGRPAPKLWLRVLACLPISSPSAKWRPCLNLASKPCRGASK